jgi:hypothetical protein
MSVKYGEFQFPKEMGFTESCKGHAHGGKVVHKALGGTMQTEEPTVSMPMSTAQKMAGNIARMGAQQGAKAAVAQARMPAPRRPPVAQIGAAGAPVAPGGPLAAAKGGFIKGAIHRPGRETERAHESGRSVHEQMEHDKHSSDPSLRSAANLGLRLTGGDLKPHRGRK